MDGPKVSTDTRTTEDNPAFLAYVLTCIAKDLRERGSPAYLVAATIASEKVAEHGQMPEGVFVPEDDFKRIYAGLIDGLKDLAADVLMKRAAKRTKH